VKTSAAHINCEDPSVELAARRDVSEHSQTESELRFQSEVMRNIPCGVMVARTSNGVMVYANSVFEEMFGYSPGELAGKHVSIINAPVRRALKQ
jgi:PAS domain-containing protein